jgi:hypothetical protein
MTIAAASRLLGVTRRDLWLLRDVGKLSMAAAIAAIATAAVRISIPATSRPVLILLVCGLMFASVYLIATIGLRIVTTDERDVLRAQISHMLRWKRTYGQ